MFVLFIAFYFALFCYVERNFHKVSFKAHAQNHFNGKHFFFPHLILPSPISLCLPQIYDTVVKLKPTVKEVLISIEFKDNRILLIDNKAKRIVYSSQPKWNAHDMLAYMNTKCSQLHISNVNDNIDINLQIVIKNGFMNETNNQEQQITNEEEGKNEREPPMQYEWGKAINQSATFNSIEPSKQHTK